MNLGLGVIPFWCGPVHTQFWHDAGMFRSTFTSDPVNHQAPEAAYYVLRTLCAVMDGAEPAEVDVPLSSKAPEFECYSFTLPGKGMLVAVWLRGRTEDCHRGVESDVVIKGVSAQKVTGVDTLNGFEQELDHRHESAGIVVPGLLVRDYPVLLRLRVSTGSPDAGAVSLPAIRIPI